MSGEEGSDKTKRKRACRESRGKKSKGRGHICTVAGLDKRKEYSVENQKAEDISALSRVRQIKRVYWKKSKGVDTTGQTKEIV